MKSLPLDPSSVQFSHSVVKQTFSESMSKWLKFLPLDPSSVQFSRLSPVQLFETPWTAEEKRRVMKTSQFLPWEKSQETLHLLK